MVFFATGATWAALVSDQTIGRLHRVGKCIAIWIPVGLYAASTGTLIITIEFAANVWLTRFLCLLIGASLYTCLLGSL